MRIIIANGLALVLAALVAAPALGNDGMGDGRSHGRNGGEDGNHHGKKHARHNEVLLAWKQMYGVAGPFLGEANALRGVPGDELPWEIEKSAKGFLTTSGHLVISVRGLVFPESPEVPPELQGTNDEAEFRGLVSCVTVDDTGAVGESNVITHGFAATPTGNSLINAELELPDPCIAPVVMVLAGSEDKWFAVTGFVSDDGDGD